MATYSSMKNIIILISMILISGCSSQPKFPEEITESQLEGEVGKKFFAHYGSFIHLESGKFSESMGKVLFKKNKEGLEVGFYYPTGLKFKLLAPAVFIENTSKVVATTLPNEIVPVYKVHGGATAYVFAKNGKVLVHQP